jgi:uncharacterized protein (DUF302 family)
MKYYHSVKVKDISMGDLRLKVEEALKKEGFGILTEIDIQATMKKKLDKNYLPHIILGACNPVYADKVLSIDPRVSTMLPCNVTLRELENGEMEVAAIDPLAAMGAIGNSEIEAHAKEVNEKLIRVLENI